jgi:Penicillin binding protein transpeptidase domain
MRNLRLALTIVAVLFFSPISHLLADDPQSPSSSLYAQSAAQAVTHALAECDQRGSRMDELCSQRDNLSYLLLDAHSGSILASNWRDANIPTPLGSLVKPFAALAYGEKHQFKYPVHLCRGTASGCWLPRGHGRIGLQSAIANSCNSYFRMLTRDMTAADVQPIVSTFGLQPPDAGSSGADLAGLGGQWLISPVTMAHAYVELSRRFDQPGVRYGSVRTKRYWRGSRSAASALDSAREDRHCSLHPRQARTRRRFRDHNGAGCSPGSSIDGPRSRDTRFARRESCRRTPPQD